MTDRDDASARRMPTLLDGNVLVALALADHVHHDAAEAWLEGSRGRFATCPITQGALVRVLVREGVRAAAAQAMVRRLTRGARHEFWPDDLAVPDVSMTGVVGHRQITDAYLAALARHHSGRLATFDEGLARLHRDVAELVPPSG